MPIQIKNSATAEKIMLAAAQLFARQGYHGTSTREIARLAGLSENTLFRHFDHKEDLFWSALRSHTKGLKFRRDLQDGIAQGDAPEVVLPKIVEVLAETVKYRPELLRLIAVAFLELHWKAEAFCQEHLSPTLCAVNQYLALKMERGGIRDLDPTMLTAAFMMSVLMHPGLSRLIDGDKAPPADGREVGRACTKFWLDVLTPKLLTYPKAIPQTPVELSS
jgi:AcrR family transcriptional regulator